MRRVQPGEVVEIQGTPPLRFHVTTWTLEWLRDPPALSPQMIRGAALTTYRRSVCPRTRWQMACERCELLDSCSYGQVFESRPARSDVLRSNRTLPRPYLFRVPPGRRDVFSLTLVGEAIGLLASFRRAFDVIGERGIGRGRDRYRVSSVRPVGVSELAHRSGGRVALEFVTPTVIRDAGQTVVAPVPGPVLERQRDRISALAATWCGGAPPWDFALLGELAGGARLAVDRSRAVSSERRSGTSGARYPVAGFVGAAEWEDVDHRLLPLLAAGQYVGVGRGCTFGNGWYRLLSS